MKHNREHEAALLQPGSADRHRHARWLIPALVFVVTCVLFAPSLSCGFVDLDDARLITENQAFRGLSWGHLRWMFGATDMGHWQPLTWLSYAIDYTIAGIDPRQFHLTNVLLHAANAALLYRVVLVLIGAALRQRNIGDLALRAGAAAGALLWSFHPLRVESVTWATERRDVLSGFFLLLTALAYLRAFPPGTSRPASWGWYAVSVALLVLSLLSKAWGMSFFVIATILDWHPLGRLPRSPLHWARREVWPVLLQKLPYLALGLASARMASWAIRSIGAMRTLADWTLRERIAQAFYGLVFYLWKTLWPTKLCALYELRHGLNPLAPTYLACYALVLAGAAAVCLLRHRAPWLVAAALAYAVSVAPVLGLFQSGDQFVADRYSYIACIGWSVLAAGLIAILAARPGRFGWVLLCSLAVVGVLAWLTSRQIPAWTDSISLWRQGWRSDPTRMIPHVNYGFNVEVRARELEREGRTAQAAALFDEALEHYRIATRLQPRDGRGWYPLGNALKRRHDLAGAEAAYREAAKYLPQAYLPLVNLGYLLERDLNRPDEALVAFKEAVESVEHPRPGSSASAKPYLALGMALKNRGDIEGARTTFTRGLEMATRLGDTETVQQSRGQLAALPAAK